MSHNHQTTFLTLVQDSPTHSHLWFSSSEIRYTVQVTELLRKGLLFALHHPLPQQKLTPILLWKETQGFLDPTNSPSLLIPRTFGFMLYGTDRTVCLIWCWITLQTVDYDVSYSVSLNLACYPFHYQLHLRVRRKKLGKSRQGCGTFTGIIHHKMDTEKNGGINHVFYANFIWNEGKGK